MTVPSKPSRLNRLLADVLAQVVAQYDAEGRAVPQRQVVTPGAAAWDCPQVAVWAATIAPQDGDTGGQSAPQPMLADAGWGMRTADVFVEVVRKVPLPSDSGQAPPVDAVWRASEEVYGDEATMVAAVAAGIRSGDLPRVHSVAVAGWQIIGPDGDLVGSRLNLKVALHAVGVSP